MLTVNRKVERADNFNGNIHLQDLTGATPLSNNDPFDQDAMSMEMNYLNASGRIRKNIKTRRKARQTRKINRQDTVKNFIKTKGQVALQNAKTQALAAKNMGKTDPALTAALSETSAPQAIEQTGLSMPMKIGIGVGVLVVGVVIFMAVKSKGKKGK